MTTRDNNLTTIFVVLLAAAWLGAAAVFYFSLVLSPDHEAPPADTLPAPASTKGYDVVLQSIALS